MWPIFISLAAILVKTVINADPNVVQDDRGAIDDDYCDINFAPGQKHPSDCCQVGDILPIDFKNAFQTCEEIYHSSDYDISDSYGTLGHEDPWTQWVRHTACLDECIYSELSLLTDSFGLNKAAVTESFTEYIDEPVLTALNAALENCFDKYEKALKAGKVSNHTVCNSGSTELLGCYMREVFLNCPDALWKDDENKQCSALWDKVEECPNIHVMLHKPSLPQPPPNIQID